MRRHRDANLPRLPVLLLVLTLGWLTACATVGVPSEAQVAFDHGLRLFQGGQYAEAGSVSKVEMTIFTLPVQRHIG
jgi:hypothetical protein